MANGLIHRHWFYVARNFLLDALIVVAGFAGGTIYRFHEGGQWPEHILLYYPAILSAAFALPCAAYIFGLYAPLRMEHAFAKRFGRLATCLALAILAIVAMGYVNWSTRMGRGVMVNGTLLTAVLASAHHFFIYRRSRKFRERVAFIVNSQFDEREARVFASFGKRHLQYAGMIIGEGYTPEDDTALLGSIDDIENLVREHKVDRVLCTTKSLNNATMRRAFCQLRYSGVTVVSLVGLCEEVYQFVPLELVSPEWLLGASEAPQMLYIKKIKRGFDICASLGGLVFLGPFLLLGMLAVKFASPGPVFYRQTRVGRFGTQFDVLKLRTMRIDAEKDGAQWAEDNDPRVTRVGRFLRRYRIDEIPQLVNVFRGDMSFVGPRPERPEFIEELSKKIPYFKERLLIQPGITGWAQVNYPYGSSEDDARRKLEYDLYYLKHMSVFLDMFIMLDTVAIILRGGLGKKERIEHPVSRAILEHYEDAETESVAH